MIWKVIIIILSTFGSIWFGRLAWIAGHTMDDFTFYIKAPLAIVCILITIGLGIWIALT